MFLSVFSYHNLILTYYCPIELSKTSFKCVTILLYEVHHLIMKIVPIMR